MTTTYRSCLMLAVPASLLFAIGAHAQNLPADASAPATAANPSAEMPAAAPSPTPAGAQQQEAPSTPKIQQISSLEDEMIGGIDWEANVVYAVGDGIPPASAVSPAQARVRAKRAALDEAMARLLEMVEDVRVDAESTTRDFINESRAVNTAVSGLVRNAEIEEIRQFDDGSYQVKMRMPIHDQKGLSRTLLPSMLNQVQQVRIVTRTTRSGSTPAPQQTTTDISVTSKTQPPSQGLAYTALIIDASGIGASPAMYPRILGRSGEVLYDLSAVDPNVAVLGGICAYRTSLDKAKQDARAGSNPLVVKAGEAAGTGKSDLVVEDADAAAITALGTGVLHEGKVIVITE